LQVIRQRWQGWEERSMKIVVAVLISCFTLQAEDVPKEMVGTWKCDLTKTDWAHKPGGAPREITLMITAIGWRYDSEAEVATTLT